MDHLLRVNASVTPTVERPDADKVLSGDPVHTTWNLEDRDGLYCGLWQSTPGTWRVSYSEWEYFRLITGVSILTDQEGQSVTLRPGDGWIIRPGFVGTWQVVETTLKDYVIRTLGIDQPGGQRQSAHVGNACPLAQI